MVNSIPFILNLNLNLDFLLPAIERMSPRRMKATIVAVLLSFLVLGPIYLHISHQLLLSDDNNYVDVHSTVSSVPLQPHQNLAIQEEMISNSQPSSLQSDTESVLLPDWQVMVIWFPIVLLNDSMGCLFQNGAMSGAKFAGVLSGNRHAFICTLPPSVRRLRPFYTPSLVNVGLSARQDNPTGSVMARWNRLAYESLSTPHDVIVFAKGINNRQTVNRPANTLRCVFSVHGAVVDVTEVTSSTQEVFRCGHPSVSAADDVRVSIKVVGDESAIASVAMYHKSTETGKGGSNTATRKLLCASTMVYNVSKFLQEWVKYHAAIGIEKFVLYDNGSEDDLQSAIARTIKDGKHDISVVYWPWSKTQEASFSHSTAANRDSCTWMAFIDVDEFLYSPAWSSSSQPNPIMLASMLLQRTEQKSSTVGQLLINCFEFGPTGQSTHPKAGVTQGYTCRKRGENRHKSILRLDAVDDSLVNSIHHFSLNRKRKWETKWFRVGQAVVNHYKFQAWEEFRVKFRRRASSYVADWKEAVNPGSKDRTPGLGFDPVEPEWWAQKQACEVNDTGLKDLTKRWFGGVGPNAKMAWEE